MYLSYICACMCAYVCKIPSIVYAIDFKNNFWENKTQLGS